jgi:membrane protein YdbS with pleckstrin-like domain
MRMTQGPVERALRLASVQPQTVYGVVGTELHGLDLDLALELFGAIEHDLVERVGLEEEHWGRRMPTGGVA